jgi:hypothetical protein
MSLTFDFHCQPFNPSQQEKRFSRLTNRLGNFSREKNYGAKISLPKTFSKNQAYRVKNHSSTTKNIPIHFKEARQ